MKFPAYTVLLCLLSSALAAPAPPVTDNDVDNAPTKNWQCGPRTYAPNDILVAQRFAVRLQNEGETRAPTGKARAGYPDPIQNPAGVPGLPTNQGALEHYPILFPSHRNPYNGKAALGDDRVVYTYTPGAQKSKFIAIMTHTGAPKPGAFVLCKEVGSRPGSPGTQ